MHFPFPRRTSNLLLVLAITIVLLVYLRLNFKPTPSPQLPIAPSPTHIPSITPSPSPTASPSATINPQTGWLIYKNAQYGFTFDYPPDWQISEFSKPPQPIVLVGTNDNGQLAALTVTLQAWAVDDTPFTTASGSAFSYAGWQGHRTTTTQADSQLNFIQTTKTNPGGQAFRVTWLNSLDTTNPYTINAYFKPILASFKFSTSLQP